MSWVRLDDNFPGHRKVLAASPEALWLHIEGLCYCAHQKTDGVIPSTALTKLTRFGKPKAIRLAARLIEVGLWEWNGAGYVIHDYLDYNPSRAWFEQPRKRRRERKRVRRQRIIDRDGMICQLCLRAVQQGDLHIDHIIPLSRGGTSTPSNLQVTHAACNLQKGASY